jgi:hypothetical protein
MPGEACRRPWVSHTVSAVVVATAGLLLGALAGVLIGLTAGILLAGPEATPLLVLGGAGEGALAGVVIGGVTVARVSSTTPHLWKESPMEATILCIFAVTLYSIVVLAPIVLPPRFGDSLGEDRR